MLSVSHADYAFQNVVIYTHWPRRFWLIAILVVFLFIFKSMVNIYQGCIRVLGVVMLSRFSVDQCFTSSTFSYRIGFTPAQISIHPSYGLIPSFLIASSVLFTFVLSLRWWINGSDISVASPFEVSCNLVRFGAANFMATLGLRYHHAYDSLTVFS